MGILVSYLVALLILKVAPGSAGGLDWRLILGIGAIPALVAVALRARMPESPRWLMLNGRYADTAKAFGLLGMDVSEEQAKQAADELAQVEQTRRRKTAWTAHREPAGRLARVGRCPRPGGDGGVRHRRQRQRSRRQGRGLRRQAAERERPTRFAAWFGQQWGERAPSRWNVSLDAVRSAAAYWQRQGWIAADPSRMLERRKPRPDRARALFRADVEQLPTREGVGLRERTLWRMLYETAARSAEVLTARPEPRNSRRVREVGRGRGEEPSATLNLRLKPGDNPLYHPASTLQRRRAPRTFCSTVCSSARTFHDLCHRLGAKLGSHSAKSRQESGGVWGSLGGHLPR